MTYVTYKCSVKLLNILKANLKKYNTQNDLISA